MAKLFVICGHGAGDSGAVGNGYQEAERVRALGKRIKELGGNSVMLGDVNRNFYKDKGILNLNISKDYKIIELHMDSNPNKNAKGAHIIIKDGFEADAYDEALANFLCGTFPGRSKKIVGRSDLANVNRAATKGYNYRLAECGFISNAGDVKIFNENLDKIARGILEAFGIVAGNAGAVTPTPPPAKPSKPTKNKLAEDGSHGPATTKRKQQIYGTKQDGVISGQPTVNKKYCYALDKGGCVRWTAGKASGSDMARAEQRDLNAKGYYKGKIDGYIGRQHVEAKQRFLKDKGFYSGAIDGSYGPETCKADQRWMNSL